MSDEFKPVLRAQAERLRQAYGLSTTTSTSVPELTGFDTVDPPISGVAGASSSSTAAIPDSTDAARCDSFCRQPNPNSQDRGSPDYNPSTPHLLRLLSRMTPLLRLTKLLPFSRHGLSPPITTLLLPLTPRLPQTLPHLLSRMSTHPLPTRLLPSMLSSQSLVHQAI